jgi:hypothetical protein
LEDKWQVEFQKAVYDWDNGNPDALTLSTIRVDYDFSCSQVEGVMKVCNGNYGETGWLGINIIASTKAGIIVSSVAKMNEYYLTNAAEAQRQYTMCHEMGHGFGLPHTDENFDNADTGNCLDYTRNPQNNLLPGTINYDRLAALYGVVSRRFLRRFYNRSANPPPLNPTFQSAYQGAMVELEQDISTTNHGGKPSAGWTLLESHPRGSKFEKDLGEGHTLHVHVLNHF